MFYITITRIWPDGDRNMDNDFNECRKYQHSVVLLSEVALLSPFTADGDRQSRPTQRTSKMYEEL
jgi:hypothetical protein